MRYPAEETAEKHERLINLAAGMFRERGIDAVSVSEVMKAAGMTHGAFYSHFESKDDLVSAAIREAMKQGNEALTSSMSDPASPKTAFLNSYLSIMHRDMIKEGCPMPALAIEIGRRCKDKTALGDHVRRLVDRAVASFRWSTRGSKRDQAILMTSAMVGAVILARAVDDPSLSEEILAATRRQLVASQ
jgi:TetR/AcrR family transcriptional repressor of nem operon